MPLAILIERVRTEYLEMPGLRLTVRQAQRLCGMSRDLCTMVLAALVDARFLCVNPDRSYTRAADDEAWRPRPAAAGRESADERARPVS